MRGDAISPVTLLEESTTLAREVVWAVLIAGVVLVLVTNATRRSRERRPTKTTASPPPAGAMSVVAGDSGTPTCSPSVLAATLASGEMQPPPPPPQSSGAQVPSATAGGPWLLHPPLSSVASPITAMEMQSEISLSHDTLPTPPASPEFLSTNSTTNGPRNHSFGGGIGGVHMGAAPYAHPASSPQVRLQFKAFQTSYLTVYGLAIFADWLKGPYVYALYEAYGFSSSQIASLFVGGFISSLVFGTVAGSLSDKYGRRCLCVTYCIVYALSALTKVVNSFAVLFLGRVLGGIATSLLCTCFEAWMVGEHRRRQFHDDWLSQTFSKTIVINGVAAIGAGVAAQIVATLYGFAAPFLVAIPPLLLAAVLMRGWRENYGDRQAAVRDTLTAGVRTVLHERKLLLLGSCQALFEAAMYVWVFFWTPCLTGGEGHESEIPLGLVFSAYMAFLMLGGSLAALLSTDHAVFSMHATAAIALSLAYRFAGHKTLVFLLFTTFEGTVGLYFAAHGTLRAQHVPEASRSAVLNLFRFPMNSMVVAALHLGLSPRGALAVMSVAHIASLLCYTAFKNVVDGARHHHDKRRSEDDG